MNYANMIQEENLKKTFIIATLCSTLVGTFSSSMGLWDRVKERRKQQKRDIQQDSEIKALREKVEASERRPPPHHQQQQHRLEQAPPPSRDSRGGGRGGGGGRSRDWDRDEVGDAFERSGALIRREFDDGYERYGRRFAVGDAATENRLQAQVIALQQTVIAVLQDALAEGRQLTRADAARLVAASDAARDGSLDALRQQRRRLMATSSASASRMIEEATPPRRHRSFSPPASIRRKMPLPEPEPEPRYAKPRPRSQSRTWPARPRPRQSDDIDSFVADGNTGGSSSIVTNDNDIIADDNDGLFCPYSLDLQHGSTRRHYMPLASAFAPGGDRRCPACGARLAAAAPDDVWAISKRVETAEPPVVVVVTVDEAGYERKKEVVDNAAEAGGPVVMEEREFRLGQRFLVKCHTPTGEYACVLCRRHRAADAICRSAEALAHHVGRAHDVAELEAEADLEEVAVAVAQHQHQQRALPAPPPPPVPMPPSLPMSPPPQSSISRAAATAATSSPSNMSRGRDRGRDRDRDRDRDLDGDWEMLENRRDRDEDESSDFRDRRHYALPAKYR
ncbi:hypothetical protein SLS62_008026 [Diatrype stigma]|uniref:Uncharacterized protein n=1 Tax=Diatrype stigma TaxID=117547 RepID=A0AAN9YLV0_9PEZI